MLKLKDVSVAYKEKNVLNKLNLSAEKGEVIGVVAPNGTGKTTLFHVMANFLKPNAGTVTFFDSIEYKTEKDELTIHKQLVTFPDQGDLFDELSGVDHLNLYANLWKGTTKHVPDIIDRLQMTNYVKRKVKTYSLGMRQRLCFAMMAAADTPIMLMDEVMNGLDVANVAMISNHLLQMKKEDKLIFIASHLLENLDLYADRVLFLKDGVIVYQEDLHEASVDYIKIELKPDQYKTLCNDIEVPEEHHYIAKRLFCLPLSNLTPEEKATWIERLLLYKGKDLTIGPLGTVEFYEKYYHEE
ncbi:MULTISPECIES: ABC transporter ATP-binding protein [unclassified Virgibacillus]|uniref:ATP-binding cassette domain-containing protein n=1 Tax=unclassified Virgibacillus TaxID=2620237 RepID=UPI0024DE8416|nr:ABC transporter ATP-binding protein [Virgibacillus sp. LDC-1]